MQLINILVIEDDPADRALIEAFFLGERICNRVDYAEDIEHARSMLQQAVEYHLILLDVHLGPASGFDLLPLLKRCQSRAELVCMSSSADADALFVARNGGAAFFIAKPLNIEGLRHIIGRLEHFWLGGMATA